MSKSSFVGFVDSPVGILRISCSDTGITGVEFRDSVSQSGDDHPLLARCVQQLEEYFRGERQAFDLPLDPHGSDFQKHVWQSMGRIRYGKTVSYLEIARAIGSPGASRAVGTACGRNPIVILIPCHRVMASGGGLGGFSGGLERKRTLLSLEKSAPARA